MDLKEFIQETLASIIDATDELRWKYEPTSGVVINPPVSPTGEDLYQEVSAHYNHRKVTMVEFDVAVTATEGNDAGGKAGLKIFAAELGVSSQAAHKSEEVSRVRFTIPIALNPSIAEINNRKIGRRQMEVNELKGDPLSGL